MALLPVPDGVDDAEGIGDRTCWMRWFSESATSSNPELVDATPHAAASVDCVFPSTPVPATVTI